MQCNAMQCNAMQYEKTKEQAKKKKVLFVGYEFGYHRDINIVIIKFKTCQQSLCNILLKCLFLIHEHLLVYFSVFLLQNVLNSRVYKTFLQRVIRNKFVLIIARLRLN